ncbi:MAG TPA: 4-hydroxy-3-methylbut-2-enyl diphosphate reductase [Thermomicrobiales bacterium]|nr:4-hydroxy-3-methylbut-2-enyl diphosphate reductase [Thermomicrobiales bacterium]
MGVRQIIVAEEMGYCWGVRRALDIIQEAGDPANPVATIGDVIHNPQVVERLRSHGVDTATTIAEAAGRGFTRVAITAHGAGPHMATEAAQHGVELLDTTCPLVTKVQRMATKLAKQGYTVVVYGDSYHPEVKGIMAWSGTTRIFPAKKLADLPWDAPRGSKDPDAKAPPRKVAVVSQTTKNTDEFMKFVNDLTALVSREGGEIRICNTICEPTYERQNALKQLASQVDLILAIGGKKSSNTARLAEVGNQMGVQSYHIQSAEEIDDSWLEGVENVGITAGASTPDDVIQQVVDYLTERGLEPPAEGLRKVDLEATPSY